MCVRVLAEKHPAYMVMAWHASPAQAACGMCCMYSDLGLVLPMVLRMMGSVPAQYVPVDTIICFRASMPLVIAVIEWLYMGRELPSARSWASMLSAQPAPCPVFISDARTLVASGEPRGALRALMGAEVLPRTAS